MSEPESRMLTMRQAILEGIREVMRMDQDVVVLGQDIGAFEGPLKSTEGLLEEFGATRIVETPICEASMTSLAVGAALGGMKVIVEIMFTDLLPVATTALVQVAGAMRYMTDGLGSVPIVVRARGGDGPYRAHPQNYEALFLHAPGMTVVVPSNPADGKGLIKSAIRSSEPVLFVENIFLYNAPKAFVPEGDHAVALGQAAVARAGDDATVVTYGRGVRTAISAANVLARRGIHIEVIDLRTLSPLDEETVMRSVRSTGRLLTVHEAWLAGGVGAEIVARVSAAAMEDLKAPPRRIGAPPVNVPWAEPLRDQMVPSVAQIESEVMQLMGAKVTAP